ncbi:gametogenetin-binding protein 2-like [Topomyia yanbarensis]|uniref:gametogenetin-binding protein 2-like n=1 Tax=Topomyia yanbarensis TaxID=2498891 RepID=UPI00273CC1C4|nr:gametogenetin-binding protein 2-like [Topomyia yanbarensis]
MAKLTYLYRSDEVNCVKVSKRQIPLIGGENLMMLMDLNSKGLVFDQPPIKGLELEEFTKKYQLLSLAELRVSLQVSTTDFTAILSQNVPCVGCRRSVERLFYQLMLSGHPTFDPVVITSKGILTISEEKIRSPQSICTLLHKHKTLLDGLLENQLRNRKKIRCNLHSLESFRSRPFSETWVEVWNCMNQQCKDEVAVVEASELQTTLDAYLRKHKFCQECRSKVEKAYCLLVYESNPTKEQGYAAHLYSGIKRCLMDKHIHLQTKHEYIDGLIKRAEPELNGRTTKNRERHAKTLEIAQDEVLTCIGMCLYEKLRRISVCLHEEENACQVFSAVAVYALRRSFDMAVEQKQGISNLELLYEEISREEKCKEQKREQKKLKKRRKRNEKKHLGDIAPGLERFKMEPVFKGCFCTTVERSYEETQLNTNTIVCNATIIDTQESLGNINHKGSSFLKSDIVSNICKSCDETNTRDMCTPCALNDGGYSSEAHNTESSHLGSRTSSIVSTPEGSEVACSDGFCNHDSLPPLRKTALIEQAHSIRKSQAVRSSVTRPTMTLQEMLDKSSTEDDDTEMDVIPHEHILAFKLRSNIIRQQREALRKQLLNNFKRLCINQCKKELHDE